jgi:cobalt-zinc-cadmium efflux system outer membrane protein
VFNEAYCLPERSYVLSKISLACFIAVLFLGTTSCISNPEIKRFQKELEVIDRGEDFFPFRNGKIIEKSEIGGEAPNQEVWADALTLEEAIALALHYNFDLRAERRQLEIAEALLLTAKTWQHNPELELGYFDDRLGTDEGENELGIRVSQEFEIGGQRTYRKEIALADIAGIKAKIADKERKVILETRKAFYAVLLAQNKLNLAQESVDLKKQVFDAAKARYKAMDIPELEVNLGRLEYQVAIGELAMVKREFEAARLELHASIGKSLPSNVTLIEKLSITSLELDAAALWNEAVKRRVDLKALRFEGLAAKGKEALARAERYPDVEVGLFSVREKEERKRRFSGLEITVPIPIFNRKRGEIAEAQAKRRAITAEINALEQNIRINIKTAINRIKLALETIALYRDQFVKLSRKNVEQLLEAYKAGEVGILEVLNAQENFNRIVARGREAQFEYHDAVADLESILNTSINEVLLEKKPIGEDRVKPPEEETHG